MSPKRPQRDPDGVTQFIERFSTALVEAGVPQMPALVFVALLATDSGRLTADELATQLRVSRAAISGAVKYLTQLRLVSRERVPGTRRQRYFLQDPTWYELVARREQVLLHWIVTTREGVDALGPDSPAGERLTESLRFFEFAREELLAMLERWQARRTQAPPRD
jgi:DNA-binding transcriptional regulator GbsR (MarR family)